MSSATFLPTSTIRSTWPVIDLRRATSTTISCSNLGCGARDGPWHLAQFARKVVAIDNLPNQLRVARRRYEHQRIVYLCSEALHLGTRGGVFDTVISLEVIEHLKEHGDFLGEICYALKPGGTLVLSTPNREGYPIEGRTKSPYHIKELSHIELAILLQRFFTNVEIFGISSGRSIVGYARSLHRLIRAVDILGIRSKFTNRFKDQIYQKVALRTGGKPKSQTRTEDLLISQRGVKNAPFLIAICHEPISGRR